MLPFMPLEMQPSSPRPRWRFSLLQEMGNLVAGLLRLPRRTIRIVQRQFGLRTLFLVVFVVALGGAWIAHEKHESARQLAIVSELEEDNCVKLRLAKRFCATDIYDCTSDNSWWHELLGDLCGERIADVVLEARISDRTYELLAQLP